MGGRASAPPTEPPASGAFPPAAPPPHAPHQARPAGSLPPAPPAAGGAAAPPRRHSSAPTPPATSHRPCVLPALLSAVFSTITFTWDTFPLILRQNEGKERNIDERHALVPPAWGWALSQRPRCVPLNLGPFGLRADALPIEPNRLGLGSSFSTVFLLISQSVHGQRGLRPEGRRTEGSPTPPTASCSPRGGLAFGGDTAQHRPWWPPHKAQPPACLPGRGWLGPGGGGWVCLEPPAPSPAAGEGGMGQRKKVLRKVRSG